MLKAGTSMLWSNRDSFSKIIDVALEAGKAVLDIYFAEFEVSYKKDLSPLTIADKRSHEIIKGRLNELFPSFPVFSEEGKDIPYEERKGWEYFWLVDPLDGTKEFIKRNGEFTVNIALIYGNRPFMGLVYAPVKGLLYVARRNEGTFKLQGRKLSRIKNDGSKVRDGYTAVVSRSHTSPELEKFLEAFPVKEKMSAGSSLKFCIVAEGEADIYPRLGPTMEWDTAAGQIIVEEAGGKVLEFESGKPLTYNKENLANPWFVVTA